MFPREERGRAMGMIGSAVLLGVALGPSIGGFIIELAGWRWMFLVNIPVGVAAIMVVSRFVPKISPRVATHAFDWAGTILGAAMLCALALGLIWGQRVGFSDPMVLGLLALSGVSAVAFFLIEARVGDPLLDLALFRNTLFARGLLMAVLMFMVLGGTGFLMPFFLEDIGGFPAARVGMLLAISPIAGGVVAPIGGTLADRIGAHKVTLSGLTLIACGCGSFVTVDAHPTLLGYALRVVPIGMGMGFFNAANNSSVLNVVSHDRLGIASALLSLMRTLGQTTGVPLIAAVFTIAAYHAVAPGHLHSVLALPAEALLAGIHVAFGAAGLLVVFAIFVAAAQTKPGNSPVSTRSS
jgi:MFS family permease